MSVRTYPPRNQTPLPKWMYKCAGHAFFKRGEVEASLSILGWREWERRGWSYVRPDEDSADYHADMFREHFKIDRLFKLVPGNREVLRAQPPHVSILVDQWDRRKPRIWSR